MLVGTVMVSCTYCTVSFYILFTRLYIYFFYNCLHLFFHLFTFTFTFYIYILHFTYLHKNLASCLSAARFIDVFSLSRAL